MSSVQEAQSTARRLNDYVLRTKYANICILEPFGAVLGMEWIAYAWSKVNHLVFPADFYMLEM
ncbi:hypothetical protein DVH24_002248 [Malus domestica]|uniref:Uncharacterized protein n=1 Tax=Malus domestica TaxID=3750 RepID=A0A498I665_MALDO|nr:hypothetical protein DVH24_002248 [Malus domestica]